MPSPGRWGHPPVPSQGWGPPRFRCASSARTIHALTRPSRGTPPGALTRMDFPSGAPGPATAPAPGQQPLGREPLGPAGAVVQLNPRAHRTPPHLPRSRLPSRPDRADSDTLDIRFTQLRNRIVLVISGSLHDFDYPLQTHSAHHGIHLLLFWIRLLQIALQIFQPLVPVPAPRPYPTLSLHHFTGLYRYDPACSSALSSRLASLFGL
jgi:hypothetical protein